MVIPTGFPGIDRWYLGIGPRELWVVGGYTSSGKTYFLLQLVLNLLRQGKKVAYFSLEMSSQSLVSRLWGNVSGLSATSIEWGWLTPEEINLKVFAFENLKAVGDQLAVEDSFYSIETIDTAISNYIEEGFTPDLIIIDYLQNLISSRDEYEKLTQASAALQLLSKKYDLAIVAASQVSNSEASMNPENSRIIGFKGSGAIAASCDFALWLENKSSYEEENVSLVDILIRKSRRGPKRKFHFQLSFPAGRFEEIGGQQNE